MTSLRDDILSHFEDLAPDYDTYKKHSNYYYSQLQTLYHELIAAPTTLSILEIGCGTGDILAGLNPKLGVGLDISLGMIEIARRKYANRANLFFTVGEAEKLQSDQLYDVVIMPDVIEHLYDPTEALSAVVRVLKPDGLLITSIANHRWAPLLDLLEKIKLKMPEGPHNWISSRQLTSLLTTIGFTIKKQGCRCLVPAGIPWLADAVNARFHRFRLMERLGLIDFIVAQPSSKGT